MKQDQFDVVLIGTGFASSFFLHRLLKLSGPRLRILVLERGVLTKHSDRSQETESRDLRNRNRSYTNVTPEKEWTFRLGFGGGSTCWYACTPRMLPDDFRLRTKFGIGTDWPITYDELEPFYADAEDIMQVAGPSDDSPFPRSRPYPQAPHRMNAVDQLFKKHFPSELFAQPCARPTSKTETRPACCGNGVCHHCPVDAKFTVQNELNHLYSDPRVELRLGANVVSVETSGGLASHVVYEVESGDQHRVGAAHVVVGANPIFNAHILNRSGITHVELGRGIGEQVGHEVILHLDGIDNYNKSTWVVGHWYGLHNPENRQQQSAALVELGNYPKLRLERGKWRQVAFLRVIYEEFRNPGSMVTLNAANPTRPEVRYAGISPVTRSTASSLQGILEKKLAALPIERIMVGPEPLPSEAHILGSVVMGKDPATSVVDSFGLHHQVRNLAVLGGSMFPTMAPANPTLTICALSLRAAQQQFGSSLHTV